LTGTIIFFVQQFESHLVIIEFLEISLHSLISLWLVFIDIFGILLNKAS